MSPGIVYIRLNCQQLQCRRQGKNDNHDKKTLKYFRQQSNIYSVYNVFLLSFEFMKHRTAVSRLYVLLLHHTLVTRGLLLQLLCLFVCNQTRF